jgi:cell division protein FtsB
VKVLADMKVAPPLRRWMTRLGLAIVVAIAIGYLPGELLRRDPRAVKVERELEQVRKESRELAARNQALYREVEAVRTDVGAVEARARADLGMVYPDEVVLRVRRAPNPVLAPDGVSP